MTRDSDIRSLLAARLAAEIDPDPHAELCHEFTVCGSRARVDLAVINGAFAGFEIKSAVDRLARLASQVPNFNLVFDEMTLVCAPRHLERVLAYVPRWYGVWVADPGEAEPFEVVRPPAPNPSPSIPALAALLWREEMLALLKRHDALEGVPARSSRSLLLTALVQRVPGDVLADGVRSTLRERIRSAQA